MQKLTEKFEHLNHFSPQATCVLLNAVFYSTLNHVHAVAPLPDSIALHIKQLTYIALGATRGTKNNDRIFYNKIPINTLQKPWLEGGCNLLDVPSHAKALHSKLWLQIRQKLLKNSPQTSLWHKIMHDDLIGWLQRLPIPSYSCVKFINLITDHSIITYPLIESLSSFSHITHVLPSIVNRSELLNMPVMLI